MPYVNKKRPYAKEWAQQEARDEKPARAERARARYKLDKEGVDRAGKDIDHKKPVSKGGTNADSNLQVVDPSKNRSFTRNPDHTVKINKPKKKKRRSDMSLFTQVLGGGGGGSYVTKNSFSNAPTSAVLNPAQNVYWPQHIQNTSKTLTTHITQDMLESEPFKVSLQVAEDLWRAAHGDLWVEVAKLNDFHYGIACRLLMRKKLEKFEVAYNEVVRVVD